MQTMGSLTPQSVTEWNEQDLLDLVDAGTKESTHLEFKESGALARSDRSKAEIAKDVSAFANADGGVLIYGIRENGHVPIGLDDGVDPSLISKEWVENVIISNIKPQIRNLRIIQIDLHQSAPGKVAYVIDIPKTLSGGPHQVTLESERRYYRRLDFRLVRMEDYEIRDSMRRMAGPALFCDVNLLKRQDPRDVAATLGVGNHASELAMYAQFDLYIDWDLQTSDSREFGTTDESYEIATIAVPNGRFRTRYLRRSWVTPHNAPIWAGLVHDLTSGPMQFDRAQPMTRSSYYLAILVRAPQMDSRYELWELKPNEYEGFPRQVMLSDEPFELRSL